MNWVLIADIIITVLFAAVLTLNAKQLIQTIRRREYGWIVHYSFTTVLFACILII